MIPPAAWAQSLHIVFGMVAARRGPHWKLAVLPAEQNPFGNGPLDEGMMLGESISAVMAHVPLPTRELGIVNDLGVCLFAFYSAVAGRLELDRQIAAAQGPQARPMPGATVGPHARREAVTALPVQPQAPVNGEGPTAADLLAGMPVEPLAAVTHERPLSGDPRADGVQLGHAPTALLAADEDPEPVLLQAFRPGAVAVPIDVLATAGEGNVLDRLAPPIEVEGQPAEREISG